MAFPDTLTVDVPLKAPSGAVIGGIDSKMAWRPLQRYFHVECENSETTWVRNVSPHSALARNLCIRKAVDANWANQRNLFPDPHFAGPRSAQSVDTFNENFCFI